MTYDLQVRQRQDNLPEAVDPYAPIDGQPAEQEGLFIKVHRILRGRYHWAVLLGLVLGAGGAFYGYKSKQPMWSSTGMIHIRPYIAPLLRPSAETGTMNAYQSFRETQVTLLRQQRVVENALQSSDWRGLNRAGTSDEVWQDFLNSLQVGAPGGNEMVLVTFTDPDSAACMAAVKGILRAYNSLYLEKEQLDQEAKRQKLDALRISFASGRDAKRDAIRSIAREFGTDDLRPIHQAKQTVLSQLESDWAQVKSKLAAVSSLPGVDAPKPGPVVSKLPKDMTVAEIALVDLRTRQINDEYLDGEARIAIVLQKLGENHSEVKAFRNNQELRKKALERAAEQWRQAVANMGHAPAEVHVDTAGMSRQQLEAANKQYEERVQALTTEVKALGLKMLDIERLRQEEKDKDASVAEVARSLETMEIESKAAGRVEIVSWGDRPVRLKDPRPQAAAMFGFGGLVLGVGFIAFLGLRDRRMHTLDDARITARLPLLGILPELPDDLADPEQASMAAHCVHQIRTLLQVGQRGEDRRSFAITSPAAGTGKTSLTLALGVSFAAASSKTLMIDCDVIGGGLTARIETIIRRKIGQILKRDGTITDQQLDTALRLAHNSQRKLGEILVELGYLVPDDIERALAMQQEEAPVGVLNAFLGEAIDDCVAETGIQGLCILPVGGAMSTDASKLSPQSLRDLLARARERFDIVLIDTGPVPGSLEASAAVTAADGVILVVSRGEHRPLVEKSLQYLQDLGARLSGMVFNRAGDRDVNAATTTTRLTSFDRTGAAAPATPPEHPDSRFGPVAGAVATSAPAGKMGTRPQQS